MKCKRCDAEVVLMEDGKTWKKVEARDHGVTCPTGGPHRVEVVKADWDSWEETLNSWTV